MTNETMAITSHLLTETPDDELWIVLIDYVQDYLQGFRSEEYDQAFLRLPKGLQMAWHAAGIEFEVPNGGFAQFFGNSTGQFAQETLEALRAFGASNRAAVLRQAIELYEKEVGRPTCSHERWFGDVCKSHESEELDHRYWQLVDNERLSGVAPYVRAHPDEFIHP